MVQFDPSSQLTILSDLISPFFLLSIDPELRPTGLSEKSRLVPIRNTFEL